MTTLIVSFYFFYYNIPIILCAANSYRILVTTRILDSHVTLTRILSLHATSFLIRLCCTPHFLLWYLFPHMFVLVLLMTHDHTIASHAPYIVVPLYDSLNIERDESRKPPQALS